MGAVLISVTYDGKLSSDKLTARFKADQKTARSQHGDSYSGSIAEFTGLRFAGRVFSSVSDAKDYIERMSEKWGPAIAVQVKDVDLQKSKRYQNALAKYNAFSRSLYELRRADPKSKAVSKGELKAKEMKEKLHAIAKELGEKSTKMVWYVGGWAAE